MRRRYVTLGDQAASSLSNILIFLLVARSFDSTEPVGAFAAAMIVYQLALGATRALVGTPLLSLYSHIGPDRREQRISDLQGATVTLGLACASVPVVLSLLLGGVLGSALLALALVLPGLLMQDTWRFALIVDRPHAALTIDLVWVVVVLAAFIVVPEAAGVAWFVLVWGLGGCLGAAAGWVLAKRSPIGLRFFRWFVDHREVSGRYFGEFATARAAHEIVTSSLGAFVGLGALGAVRASQVYYGPHNMLHEGVYMVVVPEGAVLRDQPGRLSQMLVKVSALLAVLAGVWMVIGFLLPEAWGEFLLGTTWGQVTELLLPMGLGTMASAVMSGALLGLRSLADAKRSLRARVQATPFEVACPVVGAIIGGAVGFAVGFAVARVISAGIWWTALRRGLAALAVAGSEETRPGCGAATGQLLQEEG